MPDSLSGRRERDELPGVDLGLPEESDPAEFLIDPSDPMRMVGEVMDPACRLTTGVLCIDAATGGMRLGSPVLLAGQTGTGKSLQTLNTLLRWDDAGTQASYWSLEDDPDMVVLRWLNLNGGPDIKRMIRDRHLTEAERARLADAIETVKKRSTRFYNGVGLGFDQVMACMRWEARRNGTKAFVIDHINNVPDEQNISRVGTLDNVARALASFAYEERVFLLVVAQFNRLSTGAREPRRPYIHDVKGSSTIEQLFKSIILLWTDHTSGDKMGELSKYNMTDAAPLKFVREFDGVSITDRSVP